MAKSQTGGGMPEGNEMSQMVARRRRKASIWQSLFALSTAIGIVMLALLLYNVINESFGYVATASTVDPDSLAINGVALQDLSKEQLVTILESNVSKGLMRRFERDQPFAERSRENIFDLVIERVVDSKVEATWSLTESIFSRGLIEKEVAEKYPKAELNFRSWLTPSFVTSPQNSRADFAGVRTAILGSLWVVLVTLLVSRRQLRFYRRLVCLECGLQQLGQAALFNGVQLGARFTGYDSVCLCGFTLRTNRGAGWLVVGCRDIRILGDLGRVPNH